MKPHLVPFCFRFLWINRGIGVVLIMLWVLSASVVHAKNHPFAPADQVGPYKIGYKRGELVDSSRDATFGGRTLVTHIWYPIDDATAAGATPVILAFLTFDGQLPPSPPAAVGKSRDGLQAICPSDLFYRPANFAVWNAVTLLPPAPQIPLSAFLFPPDQIPGYIDANSQYTPSLVSSTHLQIVNTEVVAFFNKHLQGDMRYHRYLLPKYAHAKKLAAELVYCKATPGKAEVCFDKHGTE
jgi:hypothetical protein